LISGLCLCRTLGNAGPVANLLTFICGSLVYIPTVWLDGLTFGSGVVSELMLGTLIPRDPRKVSRKVATRVTLEVVVDVTDVIWLNVRSIPMARLHERLAYLSETW
jgi:hypothetical protein